MSKRKCGSCGNELDADGGYWCEGFKRDVCRECYEGEVSTCQLCGDEDVMPSDVSEFILCKAELSTTATRPPGIYRVIHRPFLSIPMIGSGSLHGDDVLFVDKLPQVDAHYEISGHICQKCARPYRRTFRSAYRMPLEFVPLLKQWRGCKTRQAKWFACLTNTKKGWEFQAAYVRSVILAHPDMLRDLECDKVSREKDRYLTYSNSNDWEDLRKAYDLPADLPTFHEWVLLRHQGVKVYRTYEDQNNGDGWLSLRPEPRYRAGAGHLFPETFCASSLPTFTSYDYNAPEKDKYHDHYAWARKHSIPAIKLAIEQGLLTQSGCFDANGKELICA